MEDTGPLVSVVLETLICGKNPTTESNFSSVSSCQFYFQLVTVREDELQACKLVGIRFKSCLDVQLFNSNLDLFCKYWLFYHNSYPSFYSQDTNFSSEKF